MGGWQDAPEVPPAAPKWASAPEVARPPVVAAPPKDYDPTPAGGVPEGFHEIRTNGAPYIVRDTGAGDIVRSLGDLPGVGAAERVGQGAVRLAGKAASGVAGIFGGPDTVRSVQDQVNQATELPPSRDPVLAGANAVSGVAQRVTAPVENAVGNLPAGPRTAIEATAEAVPDVAGVLGMRTGAASRAARAAEGVEGAAKPTVGTGQTAIETGRAAGFKFSPGGAESRMPAEATSGDVPQSFAVTPKDRRAVNLHNQARVTELAGQQVGKNGATSLSAQDYDAARKPHFKTYDETGATLGSGLKGSDDFVTTLQSRLADNTQTALKGPVASQTQRILNAASSGNLTGPQMVKDISWMRQNGGSSIARALEDEMERKLAETNAGPQLESFRAARTGLAQIKNLQDVTKGGQIDAGKLAALDQKKPGLLTGNLKLIAQTAAASPQDFRLPSGVQPGSSPISKPTWVSAGKAAAGAAAKLVAPSRFDITSDAFQNRFGREASPTEATYFKDFGKRPAPPSQAFALEQPPGNATVPPRQLGLEVAQGREPAPRLDLTSPEGEVGVTPRQLGLEVAQGRPLSDQRLDLQPTESSLEPHQPSLLGHEGTPEGGSRKAKAKKRGQN